MKGFDVCDLQPASEMVSCIRLEAGPVGGLGTVDPCSWHRRRLRRSQSWILPEELQELRSYNGLDLCTISADLDLTVAVEGVTKMPRAVEG